MWAIRILTDICDQLGVLQSIFCCVLLKEQKHFQLHMHKSPCILYLHAYSEAFYIMTSCEILPKKYSFKQIQKHIRGKSRKNFRGVTQTFCCTAFFYGGGQGGRYHMLSMPGGGGSGKWSKVDHWVARSSLFFGGGATGDFAKVLLLLLQKSNISQSYHYHIYQTNFFFY